MQTQSNNDQQHQDAAQSMTTPVGREDSTGEQNVVNSQDQEESVNGEDEELNAGAPGDGGKEADDEEDEDEELEDEDFEVDEEEDDTAEQSGENASATNTL